MTKNNQNLWFKRKTYGWGWTPITWQGWLMVFFYIGIVGFLISGVDEESNLLDILTICIVPIFFLTLFFVTIAYKKGEKPRWQWGEEKE